MTIKGVGTDIIRIERVADVYRRRPHRFLKRIFTEKEIGLLMIKRRPFPSMAARFAAKEAVAKALGCGIGPVGWREIEIFSDPRGKPYVLLGGRAARRAGKKGIRRVDVSMSHDGLYALATAIAS